MRTIRCSGDASAGSAGITTIGTATTQTEKAAMANIPFARVVTILSDAGALVIAASTKLHSHVRGADAKGQ